MTDWVVGENRRDATAEILFRSFLQEAIVSSSGMGRDVDFWTLPIAVEKKICVNPIKLRVN